MSAFIGIERMNFTSPPRMYIACCDAFGGSAKPACEPSSSVRSRPAGVTRSAVIVIFSRGGGISLSTDITRSSPARCAIGVSIFSRSAIFTFAARITGCALMPDTRTPVGWNTSWLPSRIESVPVSENGTQPSRRISPCRWITPSPADTASLRSGALR
jgi:hypothetical protein